MDGSIMFVSYLHIASGAHSIIHNAIYTCWSHITLPHYCRDPHPCRLTGTAETLIHCFENIHYLKTIIFGMRLDKEKLGVINHLRLSIMHEIRCSFGKKCDQDRCLFLVLLLQTLYGAWPVPKSSAKAK